MTVKDLRTLVDNLDEYIHVPGGIDRLKKTILHLAVSGQLVPQHPQEGTGEELFAKIQAEKQKLIADGKLKKQRLLPEDNDGKIPYKIPRSWKWVQLNEVVELITDGTHHTPKYQDSGVPFLSIKDVSAGSLDFTRCKFISKAEHLDINKRCNPELGDILFCRIGTLGRPVVVNTSDRFSIFVSLGLIKFNQTLLLPDYLKMYLEAPATYKQYSEIMAGGSHTNKLNLVSMKSLITAIPPTNEQKRIVTKVTDIFELVDQLADKYKAEQEERRKLIISTFCKLSRGESTLALDMITDIIKTKADAAELRKTILHLAVSGQLVPQDPTEGTGQELYNQIQAEKQKLISEGKLKKQKPLPEITESETPFKIPETWKWVRLIEAYDVRDGTHDTPKYTSEGFPLVTSKNLSSGKLDMSNVKFISEQDHKNIKARSEVAKYDILFAMIGSIGNPVIVDTEKEFSIKNVALLKPYSTELYNPEWLLLSLKIAENDMKDKSTGGVQAFVSLGYVRSYPIPLPPLVEQTRIVKKTTQLLNLVTELEKHLEK